LSSTQERIISRVCPQCGRVLKESWVSCPYCGRNLTGRQKQLGITFEIPAFIKVNVSSVVYWSLYLSVLLVSYLLGHFYPFSAPYSLFLAPVLTNFSVGYFIRDLHTVVKMIIVGFFFHAGILLALLYSSSIPEAFDGVVILTSYYIVHFPLGIALSCVGITVRNYSSDIIALSMCLVKKMKQIIERLLSTVRI